VWKGRASWGGGGFLCKQSGSVIMDHSRQQIFFEVAGLLLVTGLGTWFFIKDYSSRIRNKEQIQVDRVPLSEVKAGVTSGKAKVSRSSDVDVDEEDDQSLYQHLEDALLNFDVSNHSWTDYLELVGGEEMERFQSDSVRMVSLKDYLRSLRPGEVNLRRIAVTLVSEIGMDMLLPFLGRVPQISPKDKVELDPFFLRMAQVFFQQLISPITLSAIGMTLHKTAQSLVMDKLDPVDEQCRGGISAAFLESLKDLPNPFRIERDFAIFVKRLAENPATQRDDRYEFMRPVNEKYLPGLNRGAPGIPVRESIHERSASRLLTVLFNKLCMNLYDEMEGVDAMEDFFVEITLNGEVKSFATPADLLSALMDHPEYSVEIGLRSLLTSFGFAICVRDLDNQIYHVPLCIPMRSGITDANDEDIVCPMSHAGVPVTVKGPAFGDAAVSVEFYQMVGSFTGWQSFVWRNWPWHLGSERWHNKSYSPDLWTPEKQLDLVRACSILSVLSNTAARDKGLVEGGYGYNGVCLDSVAIVQAAVFGQTSIFPLLFSGQARMDLLNLARKLDNKMSPHSMYKGTLKRVVSATVNLDTDIDITPRQSIKACKRLEQTLPAHSVFKLAHKARMQANHLMRFMEREYNLKEEVDDQNSI